MTEAPKPIDPRINLREATVLCVDDNAHGLEILSQMLMGFGVTSILRAETGDAFKTIVAETPCDLILVNAAVDDNTGFELVRWMRKLNLEPERFTPVIVLSGYTVKSQVAAARDCGANFVVSKPVSPGVLLDRINWIARHKRLFVEGDTYVGPDRRFKNECLPDGVEGRRSGDAVGEIGAALTRNLSQDEVENMVTAQKVHI